MVSGAGKGDLSGDTVRWRFGMASAPFNALSSICSVGSHRGSIVKCMHILVTLFSLMRFLRATVREDDPRCAACSRQREMVGKSLA